MLADWELGDMACGKDQTQVQQGPWINSRVGRYLLKLSKTLLTCCDRVLCRRQLESAEAKWHLQHQLNSPATVIENVSLGWLNLLVQVCSCACIYVVRCSATYIIQVQQLTLSSGIWPSCFALLGHS